MFYKNIMMSIAQFWFACVNGFSGQKMYNEGGIQLFNLVFTSVPILLLGIYDQDVPKEMMYMYPQLYKPCITDFFFRKKIFFKWIATAIFESVLIAIIPLFAMVNAFQREGAMWANGSVSFTAVIFVVNIKIFMIQNMWTWVHAAVLLLSILSWFGIASIINVLYLDPYGIVDWDYYWVFFVLVGNRGFWLTIALLIALCNGKDVAITGYSRNYVKQDHHKVQEVMHGCRRSWRWRNTVVLHSAEQRMDCRAWAYSTTNTNAK
jgi:magnesium-transporting ATPase (P-type)